MHLTTQSDPTPCHTHNDELLWMRSRVPFAQAHFSPFEMKWCSTSDAIGKIMDKREYEKKTHTTADDKSK